MKQTVYVVGARRIPFAKSLTHYKHVKGPELVTAVVADLVTRFGLEKKTVGDVALGSVMTSSLNWNLAREVVLGCGLDPHTPGYNVQRACGTSLETIWQLSLKIAAGQISDGIAGGVDTNSDVPIEVSRSLRDLLLEFNSAKTIAQKLKLMTRMRPHFLKVQVPAVAEPRTKLSMGQHTERMVKEWSISREAQDQLALRSHQTAAKAYAEGFYKDIVIPFEGLAQDNTLRADTSLTKLAQLKPAFDRSAQGTLTAGNSSPLTDGAAAVLLANDESATKHGWTKLVRFIDAEVAAVDFVAGEGLLMAPTIAVSRLLARQNMKLQDFRFYEIHEAFAGQVLCTLRAWESEEYCKRVLGRAQPMGAIDQDKMNTVGGSLALGHPFAATGARIVGTLAKLLHERGKPGDKGLVSICTAGGMGVAAILEA